MPPAVRIRHIVRRRTTQGASHSGTSRLVANRVNGRVSLQHNAAAEVFDLCYEDNVGLQLLQKEEPALFDVLAFFSDELRAAC
jgi:hypothetical protein